MGNWETKGEFKNRKLYYACKIVRRKYAEDYLRRRTKKDFFITGVARLFRRRLFLFKLLKGNLLENTILEWYYSIHE